ncbi:MAG: hypothetical protein FWG65_07655 [Turicibacter sp.]|nr:hypothetical protein [Turicibacter sp.]
MKSKKGFSYCCPNCGNLFWEEDALYNVGPVIFREMSNNAVPVYITRKEIEKWIEAAKKDANNVWAPSLDEILELLQNDNNRRIWDALQAFPALEELKNDAGKKSADEIMGDIESKTASSTSDTKKLLNQHYKDLRKNFIEGDYKFRITIDKKDSPYGFAWKSFFGGKLMPIQEKIFHNPNKPNALHCPQCRAVVLEGAFTCEQKLITFIGFPYAGKTCLLAALGSEIMKQYAYFLEFKRESDLLEDCGLKEIELNDDLGAPERHARKGADLIAALKKLMGVSAVPSDFPAGKAILKLYEHGYHVDPTLREGENVLDFSFRVEDDEIGLEETIYTFVDISGETFSQNLVDEASVKFPLFRNCDVFILCVEREEHNSQSSYMKKVIQDVSRYLEGRSDKEEAPRPAMCVITKYDKWSAEWENRSTVSTQEPANKSGRIANVFGFNEAYNMFFDELINYGFIVEGLSKYFKTTPMYCSAYGCEPKHYNEIQETSEPVLDISPINIDIMLKWIYFVTGRCSYGKGISRSKNNPIETAYVENYKIHNLSMLNAPSVQKPEEIADLRLDDLLVLGELFSNLTALEREQYRNRMWDYAIESHFVPQREHLKKETADAIRLLEISIENEKNKHDVCLAENEKILAEFDDETNGLLSQKHNDLEREKAKKMTELETRHERARGGIVSKKMKKEQEEAKIKEKTAFAARLDNETKEVLEKLREARKTEKAETMIQLGKPIIAFRTEMARLESKILDEKTKLTDKLSDLKELQNREKNRWFNEGIWRNEEVSL